MIEELKFLDNDKLFEKKNKQVSAKLQREISKYLLKLQADGLLEQSDNKNLKLVDGAA